MVSRLSNAGHLVSVLVSEVHKDNLLLVDHVVACVGDSCLTLLHAEVGE